MNKNDVLRRWMGVICLAVAILMTVWGQFFLPRSINLTIQVVFWGLCFAFTISAILIAFLDLAVLRRRTLSENRALFEQTMKEIEHEAARCRTRP